MMALFYLLPLVVYLPVGIYFYFWFQRFFSLFPIKQKWSRRVLSLAVVLCMVAAGWRVYGFGAVVVLYFLACCLIMEVVGFFIRRLVKPQKILKSWDFLYRSGILSVVILCTAFLYGYFNIRNIVRTEYHIETSKDLGGDKKLVQISDLHMGTTLDVDKLRQVCDEISEENADMLLLTGDIFDEHTTKEEMEAAAELLGSVDTTYGAFYVFGNHDYNHYRSTAYYTASELRDELERVGVHVLEDEAAPAGEQILVVGRRDASMRDERQELSSLIPEDSADKFLLLLDHQPVELEENAALGIDLQLSGHTHAGQIWPTGQIGEALGIVEKNYGLEKIGDFQAVVSSGIAGWGYPVRTGGHSEYVVISVEQK